MLTEEFVDQLRQLERADKLRVIQLLADELVADSSAEGFDWSQHEFEIWSPQDTTGEVVAALQQANYEFRQHSIG
jgi:hypothetical protein